MNPISIFCPVTNRSAPTGVETDWSTYFGIRNSKLRVRCSQCGGQHDVALRDSYLARSETAAELDGGRPPENPKLEQLLDCLRKR